MSPDRKVVKLFSFDEKRAYSQRILEAETFSAVVLKMYKHFGGEILLQSKYTNS